MYEDSYLDSYWEDQYDGYEPLSDLDAWEEEQVFLDQEWED